MNFSQLEFPKTIQTAETSLPSRFFRELDREIRYSVRVSSGTVNALLEWRQALHDFARGEISPAAFLQQFFRSRNEAGRSHYLYFFRVRKWMEGKFQFSCVDPLNRIPEQTVPVLLQCHSLAKAAQQARHFVFEHSPAAFAPADLRIRIATSFVAAG